MLPVASVSEYSPRVDQCTNCM